MTEPASGVPAAAFDLKPAGEWRRLTTANLESIAGLAEKVEAFEPIDCDAGHAAAAFLQGEALTSATSVTRVLIGPERVEGFIATSYTEVQLTTRAKRLLGVQRPLPAFWLQWVARHRDSDVSGLELVAAAYGFAAEAADLGGLCAFVLDPWDKRVEEVWKGPPYYFQESATPAAAGVARKLWLRLD